MYTSNYSIQMPARRPEVVSAYDYATLRNEALVNNGLDPRFSDFELDRYRLADSTSVYPVRDFYDEFTKDASLISKTNINLRLNV